MARFLTLDVFTATPFGGNQLAVFPDARGIPDERLLDITREFNFSEVTFCYPAVNPAHTRRVRIFTPGGEVPFAGHPTIGSCHAWLEASGRPKRDDEIVQECGAGLVRLRRVDGRLAFRAPPLKKRGPLAEDDVALIARGLGVSRDDVVAHAWCDNGPNWRGVMLRSAEQVLALRPDAVILAGLDVGVVGPRGKVGVVAPRGAPAGEPDFEVRAFFPGNNGLAEDPVTGSLNAALGEWLISAGLAPPRYVARQGTALGRDGRVLVERDADGHVWVAGDAVTCIEGHVFV